MKDFSNTSYFLQFAIALFLYNLPFFLADVKMRVKSLRLTLKEGPETRLGTGIF